MRLVVGLGNPGAEYDGTRHNVGFEVLARLAAALRATLGEIRFGGRFGRGRLGPIEVALLAPQTYMNRSGASVRAAVDGLAVEDPSGDLLMVVDDLDLPFGRLRLRPSGGAGGHRGLQDVIDALGTDAIPRLRFGIGRPGPAADPVDYVLSRFSEAECGVLAAHLDAAAEALLTALREGIPAAMNRVNRSPEAQTDGTSRAGSVDRETRQSE